MAEPYLEKWSRDYWMVGNSNVRKWGENEAHMDEQLYAKLVEIVGEPIVGFVGGIHYHFKPSNQVLSQECAIPKESGVSDPTLLVQR